jgi:hypothetical protein
MYSITSWVTVAARTPSFAINDAAANPVRSFGRNYSIWSCDPRITSGSRKTIITVVITTD